jgi:hypothetical protein
MGAAFSAFLSNLPTIIGGALAFVAYKIADSFVEIGKKIFFNFICSKVEIKSDSNPKAFFAIKHEVELQIEASKLINLQDGPTEAKFSLSYGTFRIKTQELGSMFVEYTKDGINLYSLPEVRIWPPRFRSRQVALKNYAQKIYKKHCAPTEMIMTFTSKGDKWSFPIIRRPTNFKEENMTPEMTKALEDINTFHENEEMYQQKGIPYRRGYLLYGDTGTGKTTVIELAAKKHNMTIYSLNINSSELNDTILIDLVATVPPNGIIVMDEIDKQIAALLQNKNKYITVGGILSAIDGPTRLSHNTIVVMTANKKDFLSQADSDALFRRGRIDRQIEFKTKLDLDLDCFDDNKVKKPAVVDDKKDKKTAAADNRENSDSAGADGDLYDN